MSQPCEYTEADLAGRIDLARYRRVLDGPERCYWLGLLASRAGLARSKAEADGPDPGRLPPCDVAFLGAVCGSHGGTEAWHLGLLPALEKRGLKVGGYGVLSVNPGPIPDAIRAAGLPLLEGLPAMRRLAAAAKVAVCWGLTPMADVLPATNRPKVVPVAHGDDNTPWTLQAMEHHLPVADRYAAVSESARRAIPADRRADAAVILNAVDPARLAASADRDTLRDRLGWTRPTMLLLSRLSSEKRPWIAVQALAGLPGWDLAVAGSGAERAGMERLAADIGAADRVKWLGVRDDVGDLLAAAEVLIAPSRTEGCGLALAEAAWIGLPVVSCPVGILEEPDHGTIVPLDASPGDWSRAVLAADSNPGRALSDREWARRSFAPDRMADEWASLIRSLMPPPPDWGLIQRWRDCPHRVKATGCGCDTCVGGPKDGHRVTLRADCQACPVIAHA